MTLSGRLFTIVIITHSAFLFVKGPLLLGMTVRV